MGMAIQAFLLITSFVLREKKNLLPSLVFPLRGFDEWGTLTWTNFKVTKARAKVALVIQQRSHPHPLLRHWRPLAMNEREEEGAERGE
jgi:hypothetical protein